MADMLNNFKRSALKLFTGGEEMDRIMADPLFGIRLALKRDYQKKEFSAEKFEDFLTQLSAIENISEQVAIARAAVEKRAVEDPLDIELNTPAKQLLWAAVLTRMMDDGKDKGPIAQSTLWKQLRGTIGLHNEGIMVAKVISAGLKNDDVTFDWGQPGSWFYQDPKKNHINLDLYFMLLTGFEHVRAIHGHEIGHAELSEGSYTPRMKELYEKLKPYIDPEPNQPRPAKLPKEEQVKMAGYSAEWQLQHRAWNCIEDISVDQFSINLERMLPQDFGDSLNYAAMLLRGYGEILQGEDLKREVKTGSDTAPAGEDARQGILDKIRGKVKEAQEKKSEEDIKKKLQARAAPLPDREIKAIKAGKISVETADRMYHEISTAALLGGYVKNGLFSDKDSNWARFRVFKDDINKTVDLSGVPDAQGRDAFQYLMDIAAGDVDSVRVSQPRPSDRMLARPPHETAEDSYRAVVAEMAEKRSQIMGKIWDIYLKPYADVLIKNFEQQVEKNLDQKNQNQQGQGQPGQGQPGQGQDGQSQPGQGQPGQGQPQDGQSGFPDDAQGGGTPQPGQGSSGEPQDIDDDLKDAMKGVAKNEQKKREQENEENKNAQSGGQPETDKKNEQDGKDGQSQGDKKSDDAKKNDQQEGKGGHSGWDQDPNQKGEPKKVGDQRGRTPVNEDMTEEQKKAMKEAAQAGDVPKPGDLSSASAGSQRGVDLAALAKGDWRDFHRRMMELSPVVSQVARAFKRIRAEQRKSVAQISHSHSYMAEDGDFDRLNMDRLLERKFGQASGREMTADDFKTFREDKTSTMDSTIETVFMIDGSGSMPYVRLSNGVTAMEAALQSAAIGYMASREAGIDSYIVIWGDPQPLIVATPDSNLKEVGEKLERLRNGTGSGTDLAPGIVSTIQSMSEHKNKNGTISGSSHILVFSDGDIFDPTEAAAALETVSRNAKNISIDVAVISNKQPGATAMEKVFDGVIKRTGAKMVGVVNNTDPQQIPLELAQLMLRRVRSYKVTTEPDSAKRDKLKKLHKKLKI